MRRAVNWVLFALFAATVLANFALRPDRARPNIEVLPDMVDSAAYASFAPNPVLPGGKTLQPPVPGTLPRGFERLPYSAAPEDAGRAGRELRNPLDLKQAAARGQIVYRNFCTPCHGASMRGDGAVALRGYPAPPNLKAGTSLDLPEGQMFHIVTFGRKNMPPHASQLGAKDRWAVVAYIRAEQDETRAAAAPAAPPREVTK